jgi:N-acetylglucosamine kinase-like BadF-type ATPase
VSRQYIGITAGATSAKIAITSSSSSFDTDLSRAHFRHHTIHRPGNIITVGEAGIRRLLLEIVATAELDPKSTRVLAGFAGGGNPKLQNKIREVFQDLGFHDENVKLGSDALITLQGLADKRHRAAVLIAGTGFVSVGINPGLSVWVDGNVEQVGGLGWRLDDSGYSLGMEGIKAAYDHHDQRPEGSPLLHRYALRYAEKVLGDGKIHDLKEVLRYLYEPPQGGQVPTETAIAGFAPFVFRAADRGCLRSQRFVEATAARYVSALTTVLHRLHVRDKRVQAPTVIGLHGSLFKSPYLRNLVMSHPELRLDDAKIISYGVHREDPDPLVQALIRYFQGKQEMRSAKEWGQWVPFHNSSAHSS